MTDRRSPSGRAFWICLLIGWGVMIFGVAGTLDEAARTHPANFALWFVGSGLAHDVLLAPAVFVLAIALGRAVPSIVRPLVQAGLIVAGSVTIVALPLVLEKGGAQGNPSALPRNYPAGLLIVLSTIAVVTALAVWRRMRRFRVSAEAANTPNRTDPNHRD